MTRHDLSPIFNPKVIAIIGASDKKQSVGYALIKNVMGSGYAGIVHPINPKHQSILGVKTYPHIGDAPDAVDLAIIATPAATIPDIVKECGKAGVKGIVIISAGFLESGEHGIAASKEISETAKKYHMRIIGPNCLGYIKPSIHLNASFASQMALPGKIALISQSGALCTAILDWSIKQNVGFSHFVSIGSMLDVGFHDLIDYFGNDPGTESIVIYMESLQNARKFLSAARAFSRTKPIIVLKAGKSIEGAHAAKSHTGTIAGNDAVFNAAFKRAGIIRVNTVGELIDSAETLAMQPKPKGSRLAIITNAGGPGVLATDALIAKGGTLAELNSETIDQLNKVLPAAWSKGNPIDVLGDAGPAHYSNALSLCLQNPNIDGILLILTPQSMTDAKAIAQAIVSIPNIKSKTVLASWMGSSKVKDGRQILEHGSIPNYLNPEDAIRCFMLMHSYSKNLETLYETPATIPHAFTPRTEENRSIIDDIYLKGRTVMTEPEAKRLLTNYGIPTNKNSVAKNQYEAAAIADAIGYPVVLKIVSPDILHKSDVGGVISNIKNNSEVLQAYTTIIDNVKSKALDSDIHGVLVEHMIEKRYELLIGAKKDSIFGPAIVFGMGGVSVEVFKDTIVGLPPLNMALARRMIEETKIYKLLKGYRGMPGVDIQSIQFVLYKFAYLISDFPDIKEIDINPFAVDENGGIVLDAKVILEETKVEQAPYSHLVISPYPKEYIKEGLSKKGEVICLRPIRPEDENLEAELFTTFSDTTQRFRFFQTIKDISHNLLNRYTQIDYDREIAIIAETDENFNKKMAGVVRLIKNPIDNSAEFAIVVGDPWQNQGIGTMLTDHMLQIAKKRKIKTVYAHLLKENYVMLNMFKKRGFKIENEDKTLVARLELK